MNKIVVPIDFSDTSKNAAHYAVSVAQNIADCGIILYNVYDKMAAGSDGTPLFNDEDARQTIALAALGNLKAELAGTSGAPITCKAESGNLVEKLEVFVKDNQADLVIMGINGATRLEQILIGSSTLGVINGNFSPVIIVPPHAKYQKIKAVAFLSDLQNVEETTPLSALKKFLDLFQPKLYVVHAQEKEQTEHTVEYEQERAKLGKMLLGYEPEFAFIPLWDFAESVNQFAVEQKIDLVITVPHRHSFINTLFKSTHTKKLAYHTYLPLLAIHE